MISEETDKGNDLSANNIIPQGQNVLCAFSCADSNGFVEGVVCLCTKILVGKPSCKYNLQYDDCRHPYIEFLVHGLGVKSLHPKSCTDTAAKDRHQ